MTDTTAEPMRVAAIQMVSGATSTRTCAGGSRLIGTRPAAGRAARAAAGKLRPDGRCMRATSSRCRSATATGPQQAFLARMAQAHRAVRDRRQRADRVRRSGARPADAAGVRSRRRARRALRQDPPVPLHARRRGLRRGEDDRRRRRRRQRSTHACGRVGLSICYDVRFPELYRALGDLALIVVPAAFTARTGEAHWDLLLRARAIENQCYVLAAAQAGTHPGGRRTWGHSMLVDPWGDVAARSGGWRRHRRRDRRAAGDRRGPRQAPRIAASDARGALTQPLFATCSPGCTRVKACAVIGRYKSARLPLESTRATQQRRSRSGAIGKAHDAGSAHDAGIRGSGRRRRYRQPRTRRDGSSSRSVAAC